ncbi:MAG: hypothetical protein GF317_01030 [Candidatus Lokiarchaeota archaeon]|nr:hypothetical protein [Candidatus Lokiarchaeota archaeon]MBD3198542.1 hypothetical protein [Candidatus Lokiarchaeota archaeon]
MVAIMGKDLFQKSQELFKSGDFNKTLETYEKALSNIDRSVESEEYISFLRQLLKHCQNNNLKEEEALVLRAMGRTYSVFKEYVESLKHHWLSLKIQRKLGKKIEVAEGLLFIAEDQEVSGKFDEAIKSYREAYEIYQKLGKSKHVKKIKKELKRLDEYSKEAFEEDYMLNKFNINDF